VVVSVVVGVVWALGLGEGSIDRATSNPDLRGALAWLLAQLDFGWITLAAANVYLSLATTVGLATARRWALLILAAVIALAWLGAVLGFPLGHFRSEAIRSPGLEYPAISGTFGHIRYGTALGLKLGPVPLGLPLLWFSVIIGARETILRFRPRWGQWPLAAAVGVVAALTDVNLELPAARLRGFWFWIEATPGEPPSFDFPLTGSLAWGILAALVTLYLRETDVLASARKRPWQPMAALAIFEAIFLAGHVAARLSH